MAALISLKNNNNKSHQNSSQDNVSFNQPSSKLSSSICIRPGFSNLPSHQDGFSNPNPIPGTPQRSSPFSPSGLLRTTSDRVSPGQRRDQFKGKVDTHDSLQAQVRSSMWYRGEWYISYTLLDYHTLKGVRQIKRTNLHCLSIILTFLNGFINWNKQNSLLEYNTNALLSINTARCCEAESQRIGKATQFFKKFCPTPQKNSAKKRQK